MKVCFLCNWYPYPVKDGPNQRFSSLIEYFIDRGDDLDIVVIDKPYWWRKYIFPSHAKKVFFLKSIRLKEKKSELLISFYWFFIDVLEFFGIKNLDHKISFLLKRDQNDLTCSNLWLLCPNGLEKKIYNIATQNHWDLVIVEHIWLHPLVDGLPKKIIRILDTHDVMHIRHQKLLEKGLHSPLPITRDEEAFFADKFDCLLAIQENEKKEFLKIREDYDLHYETIVSGIVIKCKNSRFSGISDFFFRKARKNIILFVGGSHIPNVDGIKSFITNQWPSIHNKARNWTLCVCGSCCAYLKNINIEGLDLKGRVRTLDPYYRMADIVINPVWVGTGLKIKTVDALVHGKPYLTTPVGIDGMAGKPEEACLVAKTEYDFSEKLRDLINDSDERKRLSHAASIYTENHLSSKAVYSELDSYLNNLKQHTNQ